MNDKEWYFNLHLTENEHWIVGDMIEVFCVQNDIQFLYYRKLKTGHVPMIRECKVKGSNRTLALLKEYFKKEHIDDCIVKYESWFE